MSLSSRKRKTIQGRQNSLATVNSALLFSKPSQKLTNLWTEIQTLKSRNNSSFCGMVYTKSSQQNAVISYEAATVSDQGSLQLCGHGTPPIHFENTPNKNVTKFISSWYIIITKLRLAPRVFLSNNVNHKSFTRTTYPSKKLFIRQQPPQFCTYKIVNNMNEAWSLKTLIVCYYLTSTVWHSAPLWRA